MAARKVPTDAAGEPAFRLIFNALRAHPEKLSARDFLLSSKLVRAQSLRLQLDLVLLVTASKPSRAASLREMLMMDGMGWMTGGGTLLWILVVVVLILAALALVKYLGSGK
jgi:hypothetical protein